ncbi:MAG: hypothetical protein ONB17_10475, partial [candidate division KSB1 bacterium]|nr:hypothetical protein [candidate division KSB1 bacterium]
MHVRLTSGLLAATLLLAQAALGGDDSWSTRGPAMGCVKRVASSTARPELLFAHLGEAGLFMSQDTGHSWQFCVAPAWFPGLASSSSGWDLADVVVSPHLGNPVYYATRYILFSSWDDGATWQSTSYPSLDFVPVVLLVDRALPGALVMGNYSALMVTVSLDGGLSWKAASAGLPKRSALDLEWDANGDTLFLGSIDGVFRRPWPPGGKGDWLW